MQVPAAMSAGRLMLGPSCVGLRLEVRGFLRLEGFDIRAASPRTSLHVSSPGIFRSMVWGSAEERERGGGRRESVRKCLCRCVSEDSESERGRRKPWRPIEGEGGRPCCPPR